MLYCTTNNNTENNSNTTLSIYRHMCICICICIYLYIYISNGPDSSVVRAYGLGSGRSWVRSSPCRTERVPRQTVQSLWRISSSTSGANTSCEGKDCSSLKKKKYAYTSLSLSIYIYIYTYAYVVYMYIYIYMYICICLFIRCRASTRRPLRGRRAASRAGRSWRTAYIMVYRY